MLVTSIFFFSHNVFKSPFPPMCQKSSLCGNGLTLYSTDTHFKFLTHQRLTTSENIVGKEKIARNEQFFFFSHNVFY